MLSLFYSFKWRDIIWDIFVFLDFSCMQPAPISQVFFLRKKIQESIKGGFKLLFLGLNSWQLLSENFKRNSSTRLSKVFRLIRKFSIKKSYLYKRTFRYFPFFSKELKRTQRTQPSFAKNVKQRKRMQYIYIYIYIYRYI